MAMGTERLRSLHNFTMPSGLRWGNQRFLRCMKVNSDEQIHPPPLHQRQRHRHPIQQRRTIRDVDGGLVDSPPSEFSNGSAVKVSPTPAAADDDEDEGIAVIREKVMFDLQTAADKMKDAIFKDNKVSISPPPHHHQHQLQHLPPPPPPPPPPPSLDEAHRPWNLRTRRASSKAIVGGGGSILKLDLHRPNSTAAAAAPSTPAACKSPIHKIEASAASGGKRAARPKFAVALTKRDIEEDFFAMVGHRPPRRPKKRPKFVQKELDCLFPGLWLNEVTPDMYKVHETAQ